MRLGTMISVGYSSPPFTGEELCPIGLPVAVRRTLLGVGGLSNSLGDTQVRQEVLPQKFFGMYLLHCQGDNRP